MDNMEWKDKSCENCMYRDCDVCRKIPPCICLINDTVDYYPLIKDRNGTYQFACSYYEETK